MQLNNYFLPLTSRPEAKGYVCRLVGTNDYIEQFLFKYYKEANERGVVIQGRIPNPTDANLRFYREILGDEFELSLEHISSGLGIWLVKLQAAVKLSLAQSLFEVLTLAGNAGHSGITQD